MKTWLSSLSFASLALGALLAASGCEVQDCTEKDADGVCLQGKSLKKFVASEPEVFEAAWVPGAPVSLDGVNGSIEVRQGTGSLVRAEVTRFVLRAYDTPIEKVQENLEKLALEKEGNAGGTTGAVSVRTRRLDGAVSTLGADVVLFLPATFDGALTIRQRNGSTKVLSSGEAASLGVTSDNGSCDVSVGSSAASLNVDCDNGGIDVTIAGVPAAAQGTIRSGNGDVAVSFPGSAKFSVQAQTGNLGAVSVVDAEARGCTVQVAAETAKTVSCAGAVQGDPLYSVTAPDLGDVTLRFR